MNTVLIEKIDAFVKDVIDACVIGSTIRSLNLMIERIEYGVENFDLLGDFVEKSQKSDKNFYFKVPTLENVVLDLEDGICNNFIMTGMLADVKTDQNSIEFIDFLVSNWKKENNQTHGYSGFFISGIDEYSKDNGRQYNLYRNPLRLSALKYFLDVYKTILSKLS